MWRCEYPAVVEPDGELFVVTLPGLPGVTQGDTVQEALRHAEDLLVEAIGALMARNAEIPEPPPARGRPMVALPPIVAAKLGPYRTMRAAGVSRAELGRRLGWKWPQIQRILDVGHPSRLEQIEAALRALGQRLVVGVEAME